jgi:diguanylate cyclase (GGDEF)-like protein
MGSDSTSVTSEQYRARYWAADVAQWRFALVLFSVPTCLFLWFDYRLYGLTATFYGFLAMRAALVAYSVWLWWALGRLTSVRLVDRLLLAWSVLGVLVIQVNALGRPPDFFGHYVFEVFVLLVFFSAAPMQPRSQLGIGVLYLLGALPILLFYKRPPSDIYTSNTIFVLLLTVVSGYLISRRIVQYRIEVLQARLSLELQARTDSLTGISNRRAFLDRARSELSRSDRDGRPLSLLLLDIDQFKKINDRFGHEMGDLLLIEFTRRIALALRSYDQFARFGGEEFVVLLPGCDLPEALDTARRLRQAIGDTVFSIRDHEIPMTVSIGVTRVRPGEASIDAALSRADTALYAAKDNGRNREEVLE